LGTNDVTNVGDARPIGAELQESLIEPLIVATRSAIGEMANVELFVQAMQHEPGCRHSGDLTVIVELKAAKSGSLLVGFSKKTATALSERILVGAKEEIGDGLVQDCVCEIVNVVAGQFKALLAKRPFHFAFSLPRIVRQTNEIPVSTNADCVVVTFASELGEITLQLVLQE